MELHNDIEVFTELINATSDFYGIDVALIEKDYYVSCLLRYIKERINGIVFKGGTSLSKCYKIIDRFSEDVDLTLNNDNFTQSKKRKANKELVSICDELSLKILNREFVNSHSHSNYNAYRIEYPKLFNDDKYKNEITVEMVFIQKSYPNIEKEVTSYISEYLNKIKRTDLLCKYQLIPFQIAVQTLERTLIDKVFALCDYYIRGEQRRNSRHIYDIAKLLPKVDLFSESFKSLVLNVRSDRRKIKKCVAAQDGIEINEVLKRIINSDFYKNDYIESTEKLLIKPLPYPKAINSLDVIISSNAFDL